MTSPKRILQLASQTLFQRFPNGLKLDSQELGHFACYFGANFNDEKFLDSLDDAKLKRILRAVGVVLDGKVYPVYPLEIQNVVLTPETTRVLSNAIVGFFPDGLNVESTDALKQFENAVEALRGKMPRELNSLRDDFLKLAKQAKSLINAKYVVLNRMIVKLIAPFNGVVYPVLRSTQNLVEQIAEKLFDSGIKIVYYSAFFERNKELLVEKKLVSAEFFTFWLRKINSNLVRKKFYFERTSDDAPDEEKILEEIERVLRKESVEGTEDEIIQTLVEKTFVPEDKIREVVALYPQLMSRSLGKNEADDKAKEEDEEKFADEKRKVEESPLYRFIRRKKEETSDQKFEEEAEEEEQEEQEVEESPKVDEKESTAPSNPSYDLRVALVQTLIERFPNGFPLDSKLELKKLRRYTSEKFPNVDDYVDDRIRMILRREGCLFNNRIYILSDEADVVIQREIRQAFDSGANLVYFEPLFQKLRGELPDFFSVDLLKNRVKTTLDGVCMVASAEYCEPRRFAGFLTDASEKNVEESKIAKEIKRVWGDGTVVSSDELVERLPFAPEEKIKDVLKKGGDFERNVKDSYVRLDQILVDEEDRRAAKEYVEREVRLNNYASLNNMPVGNMSLRYEEVDLNCLQRILFKDCLDVKYELRGRVVTLKGLGYNAKDLIKIMCRNESRVSLEQLYEWEQELTGRLTYAPSLGAAYDAMVRTSQDEFVSDASVSFDVEEIDKIIDELMGDRAYLPLSCFVSFSTYPNPGVAWSKFLLESFCQPRFSRKFVLARSAVNSANVGVILRKERKMEYDEILEDATLSSGVPLTKDSVLNFLTTCGYIGQKKYSKIEELLKKVKIARIEKEKR